MTTLSTEMVPKVPKVPNTFTCKKCNYFTSRYSHYQRHILTKKHLATFINKKSVKQSTDICILKRNYICELCEKKYTERSGLWRHKQICIKIPINKEVNNLEPDMPTNVNNDVTDIKKLTELVMNVVKQNNELTKQIIEMSAKPTTTNNNTTNNNTTNNNFNLQFFLNETCKDAINISDFISQLHVGIKDLEETGRPGYAEGISKIFINGLKQLEINQRPVHCSDAKRETIYIKDENQWGKDNEEKTKLTNAIRKVAHKNIEQISVWTEKHPEYMENNSKYNEKYMKLLYESMPGSTKEESDKNYKKIARNITKTSIIEKE